MNPHATLNGLMAEDGTLGVRLRRICERLSIPVMVLSALGVLTFTMLKAGRCSFTHDESITWLEFVHLPFGDLLAHKASSTNNHMLNTMLMKWSEALFGNCELALRIPNLLALVVYLVYGALLLRPFGPIIGPLMYVCLCYATDIVELFGLARGYGLSFGFMLMALYHAWRSLATGSVAHVALMHAALILSVLSSFVTLQYAVVLVCLIPVVVILSPGRGKDGLRRFKRAIGANALILPFSVLAVWEPLWRLSTGNEFEFGGNRGLFGNTFASLMFAAFPAVSFNDPLLRVSWYGFLVTCAGVLVYTVRVRYGSAPSDHGHGNLLQLLAFGALPGTMIVIVAQHMLLGTPYPEARFSKFLFPLALLFVAASAKLASRHRLFWPTTLVLCCGAAASVKVFAGRSTFHSSDEWQYDMDTNLIVSAIQQDRSGNSSDRGQVTMGYAWLLAPTIDYYRLTKRLDRIPPAHRKGPTYNEDYLILADSMLVHMDRSRYETIGHYDNASWWLFRRVVDR